MKSLLVISMIGCPYNNLLDVKFKHSFIYVKPEHSRMPTFEECIPVASPEMIKTMNLEKEPITPDVDILEASVDRMSPQEYINSVSQYFDLEEVLE